MLALIASRGGMTLAGNKEYFAVLYHRDGRWLIEQGDPLTRESTIHEIEGEYAYTRIRWRAFELMEEFGPDRREISDTEVYAFLADYPTSI